MFKKLMALMMIVSLLTGSLILTASADWGTSTMYVKTANGKSVNVRSGPGKEYDVIGSVRYGGEVLTDWSYAGNDGWTKVVWGSMGDGYIMSRTHSPDSCSGYPYRSIRSAPRDRGFRSP